MASLQRAYAAPAFAETGPRTTGARTRASRPTTAPVRPRAPASMLDLSRSARVPGYTGHTPGVLSDSLLGRSHAYLTGFRQELLGASDVNISENKRSQEEGTHFEPSQFTRKVDAASVARPCKGPAEQKGFWKTKEQYYDCLNLSENGRMPGYTGHAPHFKFEGSLGLPFAKACQIGDQQRPPDGSHNTYVHEEPHKKGGKKATDLPIPGYSCYMPFVAEWGTGLSYKQQTEVSLKFRRTDTEEIRKTVDIPTAAYTPSMIEAMNAGKLTKVRPKPENPCPNKTFAVGYSGFIPGAHVSHNTPDRYRPKTSTPMDKALENPRSIYLGDLSQEWNVGQPYYTTMSIVGEWSPFSKEPKPKLWSRK